MSIKYTRECKCPFCGSITQKPVKKFIPKEIRPVDNVKEMAELAWGQVLYNDFMQDWGNFMEQVNKRKELIDRIDKK